jgi:hypothetical protein
MRKIEREYADICTSEGVTPLSIEHRRKHYAIVFDCGTVFAAATPSDRRSHKNVRSKIRRIHR